MADKRYIPWKCADCGEEFFCLHTDGKPPSDTTCVNCGSDVTVLIEDDWPAPDSQFGVGA